MTDRYFHCILIPGQKKAGTTTLYNHLADHLPHRASVPKESSVLDSAPWLFALYGLARRFKGRVLLDATTTYFKGGEFSPAFRRNLTRFNRVSAVIIHRREVDRMTSHFRHSAAFDGWTGTPAAFLESAEYIDNAYINPKVMALRELGVTDIHIVPFEVLNDPARLRMLMATVLGQEIGPLLGGKLVENRFGKRALVPRPVEQLVATPLFQAAIRPLIPSTLRGWIKTLLARSPEAASATRAAPDIRLTEAMAARLEGIEAENRTLGAKDGIRRW